MIQGYLCDFHNVSKSSTDFAQHAHFQHNFFVELCLAEVGAKLPEVFYGAKRKLTILAVTGTGIPVGSCLLCLSLIK